MDTLTILVNGKLISIQDSKEVINHLEKGELINPFSLTGNNVIHEPKLVNLIRE